MSALLPRSLAAAQRGRLAALRERLNSWMARWRERHAAVELESLDERSLRDLGFTRSELASVRAEAEGRVEATRLRVLQDPARGWTA